MQAAQLLALLVGILVGEALTYRAFGRPKPALVLIDIVLFVALITLIYNFLTITQLGPALYLANFFIGMLVITVMRTTEAGLGMTEQLPTGTQTRLAVTVVRALAKYGLDAEEIRGVLGSAGFSPRVVSKLDIEREVPVYLPKLVKMRSDIEEIKNSMAEMTATLRQYSTKFKPVELVVPQPKQPDTDAV